MTVFSKKIFSNNSRGASLTEVILAMAIVAAATPIVYNQMARTNQTLEDISVATTVMNSRGAALNFVRMNQDKWPDVAQIRLSSEELSAISPDAVAGLIDKYMVSGAVVTDIYLAFDVPYDAVRTTRIAGHIGADAAVIGPDGAAYGQMWAVAAPDFEPGDLIYRISRDIVGQDTSRYLHRATSGTDDLNVMMRDLDMSYNPMHNIATLSGKSARVKNGNSTFLESESVTATDLYFSSGANINNGVVSIGTLRVTGDMSGFKNVTANNINGHGFTTAGRIVADRATITESVNVSGDFVLKSDSSRTISGFTGISASAVYTPYISAEEMVFYENFGLTISGELLMSTVSPLKIGNWSFPSTKPPAFSRLELSRGTRPSMPSRGEFGELMRNGWQETPISTQQPTVYTVR